MDILKIKEFIKENKSVEQYFYTGLNEKTLEQKFKYLQQHFTYDIFNSWNSLKSIANNVKIYNLLLTNEQINKYFELCNIDNNYIYYYLENIINDFEKLTDTEIYFNGRSGGYLVIKPDFKYTNRHQNILEFYSLFDIECYKNYEELKKENYNNSYKEEIEKAYIIVKAFDKLCDILRKELIYILNNYTIKEHEETCTKLVKEIII